MKTKLTTMKLLMASMGLAVIAGCGGKEAKQSSESRALGQSEQATGQATLQTKKQVTRTITSETKIPTVSTSTVKADINRMDARDFVALGFSPDEAQNIVQYRDEHGSFGSVDDLSRVEGIDATILDRVGDKLGVSEQR